MYIEQKMLDKYSAIISACDEHGKIVSVTVDRKADTVHVYYIRVGEQLFHIQDALAEVWEHAYAMMD